MPKLGKTKLKLLICLVWKLLKDIIIKKDK
jgi:hypothetical protein